MELPRTVCGGGVEERRGEAGDGCVGFEVEFWGVSRSRWVRPLVGLWMR